MPTQVMTLPSKVTVTFSRGNFIAKYGYSQSVMFYPDLESCIKDIVRYYIKRRVSTGLEDLKSILKNIDSAQVEAISHLDAAKVKRLEELSKEVESLKALLKRENYYRKKAAATSIPDHDEQVCAALRGLK